MHQSNVVEEETSKEQKKVFIFLVSKGIYCLDTLRMRTSGLVTDLVYSQNKKEWE